MTMMFENDHIGGWLVVSFGLKGVFRLGVDDIPTGTKNKRTREQKKQKEFKTKVSSNCGDRGIYCHDYNHNYSDSIFYFIGFLFFNFCRFLPS